ncbi:MAG: indolepyruvate oxidoreductase subunit beta [Chloroflexota bacterium]|nr:indolepyruvate oxidoreductase subunit beta [Chloroflexota bacterium]
MMTGTDILMTGVGGQGVILASDILADCAVAAGYDVKKTDSLGMAQRGGSVTSNVRIAQRVFSPLIPQGGAHFLVAYERLEALRFLGQLRPGGVVIFDSQSVVPLSVFNEGYHYPSTEEVSERLSSVTRHVYMLPAADMAAGLGNPRVSSVLCLGALSRFLDIPHDIWRQGIERHLPPRLLDINLAAFGAGARAVQGQLKEGGE